MGTMKLLLLNALFAWVCIQASNRLLSNPTSPNGIIDFQLCRDPAVCVEMVEKWGSVGRIYGGVQVGIDLYWMQAYSLVLGYGAYLIAKRLGGTLGSIGTLVAWSQLICFVTDFCETFLQGYSMVLVETLNSSSSGYTREAYLQEHGYIHELIYCFAVAKFASLLVVLGFILIGGLLILVGLGKKAESKPKKQ